MLFSDTAAAALVVVGAVSFATTYAILPRLIRSFTARGMVGKDMNKASRPEIAEMGGVAVVAGFFLGVTSLMVFDALVGGGLILDPRLVLAGLIACLGAAFVGAVDDLFDLRQRVKAVLPVIFGIPLGLYVADTAVHLPRGYELQFGIFAVPLIAFMVSAGANAANMLEGFNGLGSGLGLIMSAALIVLSVVTPHHGALILLVPFFGCTAAFYLFNRFPAKVFPGDTYTLFMGATLVSSAVIMGFKEVGALLFIPMIAEFLLKARTSFAAESYGARSASGRLQHKGPIGSLTHLLMLGKGRSEVTVVRALLGAEALIAVGVVGFIMI